MSDCRFFETAPRLGLSIMLLVVFGLAAAVGGAAAADIDAAEGTRLVGRQLKAAVSGSTLEYSYPWGTIPIQLKPDGTVIGERESGGMQVTGKWWVDGDRICFDLLSSLTINDGCYLFVLDGATMNWFRSDGTWAETTAYVKPARPATAVAAARPGGHQLTGAQLATVFSDARIEMRNRGRQRSIRYNADGSMLQNFQAVRDTGEWWVDGDRLCRKWDGGNVARPSRARCFTVAMDGDIVRFFRADGSLDREGRYFQ